MSREVVAKVLLINQQNQALLLRLAVHRTHPSRSHTPDLPGGVAEAGESEVQAAVRELQEETGVIVRPSSLRLLYAQTAWAMPAKKSVTKLLYVVKLSNTPPITLSWEHEAYQWVDSEQLKQAALRPFFKEAIAYGLSHGLL